MHRARYQVDARKEDVLQGELQRMGERSNPLWHIGLHTNEVSGAAYLTLSVDHMLVDGKGLFILFSALLAPDISDLPYESIPSIPLLEETIDIRPGFMFITSIMLEELIAPKLPAWIRRSVVGTPSWPHVVSRSPALCDPQISLLDLSLDLSSLKARGKACGVPTLHPILKLAYVVALWHVLHEESFKVQTPGSVRSSKLGHSHCTANYTSSLVLDMMARPDLDFWEEARRISRYMSSATGKKRALEHMGALAYVPDPDPAASKRQPDRPTGWEDFLGGKLDRLETPSMSAVISNIGKVDLPQGAIDLIWGQGASPFAGPIEVNVVSHQAGMRATAVWREGAMISKDKVVEVNRVWERVLSRLSEEREWTFHDLVE